MYKEELRKIITERRSHRYFLDKKIETEHLNELIDIMKYCPTSKNTQDTKLIVVQDKQKIKKLSDLNLEYMLKTKNEILKIKKPNSNEQRFLNFDARIKALQKKGRDPVFYGAPMVLLFYSNKQSDSSGKKNTCVIASTTVSLFARTMGIESTYMGMFEYICKKDSRIYEVVGIDENEYEIYSVIILGYPSKEYSEELKRKPIEVISY